MSECVGERERESEYRERESIEREYRERASIGRERERDRGGSSEKSTKRVLIGRREVQASK